MIKLFIARLPISFTSKMLRDLFAPFGQVLTAKISINSISQESLGCGYVEMEHLVDAQTAIKKLNCSPLEEKHIGVSIAINGQRFFKSSKI